MLRLSKNEMRGAAALIALTLLAYAQAAWAGTFVESETLEHDGLTRYFDYYIPDPLPPGPLPLLLVLHGGTQSNDNMTIGASSEFRDVADQEGYLVIIPNGTSSETGLTGADGDFQWNDCRTDAGPAATSADDVGFINKLIDWASTSFAIDSTRVFATGASNGGLMSYRLAIELSDRIAAIAAHIANLPLASECAAAPEHPLSVLIMNGTADGLMPWSGGEIGNGRGLVSSAEETRDAWRSILNADPTPSHSVFPDVDLDDGGQVELDLYSNGDDETELAFYSVNGAGHTQPSIAHQLGPLAEQFLGKQNHDIESAPEIIDFLNAQTLGTVAPGCDFAPRLDCKHSVDTLKAKLIIKDRSPDDRDRIVFKWLKGETTSVGELGVPTATTSYALCFYDASGAVTSLTFRAHIAPGASCGTAPCWRTSGSGGYLFRDRKALSPQSHGVSKLKIKSGTNGKSKIRLKASGDAMSSRPFGLPEPPFELPAIVQLQNDGACWEATFDATNVKKNGDGKFSGRATARRWCMNRDVRPRSHRRGRAIWGVSLDP